MSRRIWVVVAVSILSQAPDAASRRTAQPTRRADVRAPAAGLLPGQFAGGASAGQDAALVSRFDQDGDGRLNAEERRAAREYAEAAGLTRTRWGSSGLGFAPDPGESVRPEEVTTHAATSLFDLDTVRTLFLTFENSDWERELMAFKSTDVDVPTTLMVDGRTYPQVGVQFHGNSSFQGVPIGFKHSLRLALDFVDEEQALAGHRTLLLLNAHEDPTFVRTVLAMQIAREYYPAPRANFVRVVINGESWGIYVNQEQFNSDMVRNLFADRGGARWKIHGTRGYQGGGLAYLGEAEGPYRQAYDLRTRDSRDSWSALIGLTRTLDRTAPDQLAQALSSQLDVDAALGFLAVENALVNTDGYWSKASDYNLYRDTSGRFHVLPYDVNGTFATGFGPAGSRTGSVRLDPMHAAGIPRRLWRLGYWLCRS